MNEQTNWQQFAGDLLADLVPPPWPIGPELDEHPEFKAWLDRVLVRARNANEIVKQLHEEEKKGYGISIKLETLLNQYETLMEQRSTKS